MLSRVLTAHLAPLIITAAARVDHAGKVETIPGEGIRPARAIYDRQARERMEAGKKTDPPVNLPEGKHGDARDLAGKALGVSG